MQLDSSPGMVSSVISGMQLRHAVVQFAGDLAAHRLRQRGEAGAFRQFAGVLRKVDAQRGEVMLLPGHGIAQDHRRAIGVQRPRRVAVIFQRFARAGDRPLLRVIHAFGDARRNRQTPLHGIPLVLAHPAADLGIGLVRRAVIGVVVERRIPAIRVNLADAVAAVSLCSPRMPATLGASGRIAPTPTIAIARCAVFSMMTLLSVWQASAR